MLKRICLTTHYNLYESKIYFAERFKEALERAGIEVVLINSVKNPDAPFPKEYDLSCSFNSTATFKDGSFFYDYTKIPHWSIIVDPFFYYLEYLASPYSILSCVDKIDVEHFRERGAKSTFFWPHAVERELKADENQERPYDVVMLGSCYDEETLKTIWRAGYPKKIVNAIEGAIEICASDNKTHIYDAAIQGLKAEGLTEVDVPFKKIVHYVDYYVRGRDRVELIKSIKNAHVHVFGGTCWRDEKPVLGWSNSLFDMPNVTIHPQIPYAESLEVMKQSKIVLNSMPFFKDGSHERIFTGLATGAVPITSDNMWVRENFKDKEELFIYEPKRWAHANEWVNELLTDESKRKAIAEAGRKNVMAHHTWDNRVQEMLEVMPGILEGMK